MEIIIKQIGSNNEFKVLDESVSKLTQFKWGFAMILKQPVTLNGASLPLDSSSDLGICTVQLENSEDTYLGNVELITNSDNVYLRIKTLETNQTDFLQMTDAEVSDVTYSGSFGPFNYSVNVNIDLGNPMASSFIVKLTCMGITLADVQLDAQHPVISLGASISGIGITGELGVNFNEQRIYVAATIKYLIGNKKYNFDLYHWGNDSIEIVPMLENDFNDHTTAYANALLSNDISGNITIRNTGGYVAKFVVSYLLQGHRVDKGSGNFTAGVNKTIDIPAEATDIKVKAYAAVFFGTWSTIFTTGFPTPVTKAYEVYGTTMNTHWKEIQL